VKKGMRMDIKSIGKIKRNGNKWNIQRRRKYCISGPSKAAHGQ
jgi:hypothetical protein